EQVDTGLHPAPGLLPVRGGLAVGPAVTEPVAAHREVENLADAGHDRFDALVAGRGGAHVEVAGARPGGAGRLAVVRADAAAAQVRPVLDALYGPAVGADRIR